MVLETTDTSREFPMSRYGGSCHLDVAELGLKVPWTDRRTWTSFEQDLPRHRSDRARDRVFDASRFDDVDRSSFRFRDGRSWTQASVADCGWIFPSMPLTTMPKLRWEEHGGRRAIAISNFLVRSSTSFGQRKFLRSDLPRQ